MSCPNCSEANPAEAAFCMNCGTKLSAGCSRCGAGLPAEAGFCMKCGHRVADATPEPSDGDGGLRNLIPRELDVHAAHIRFLVAIGDSEGERAARGEFEGVVGVIVERIGDAESRAAFGQGALDMLERA